MDNTLIYSDKAHTRAYQMVLKEKRLPVKKASEIIKHFGKPHKDVIKAITGGKIKSGKEMEEFRNLHHQYLIKNGKKGIRKIKGVLNTLKKLRKIYDLALLSNCSHKNIILLLKYAGINRKFFRIIVGDTDARCAKPCPSEIFTAEHLSRHKAAFMIGDSIYDILAAKRAGVKIIAVLTGRSKRKQLLAKKPDFIIPSVAELPKLLLSRKI